MGLSDDVISRLDGLQTDRLADEKEWRDAARFAHPSSPMSLLNSDWGGVGAGSGSRMTLGSATGKIYDSTAVTAVRQLANGMVSQLMPRSQYWHGLKLDDDDNEETPHHIDEYLERLRNYLFRLRYNPGTGFVQSSQAGMRQMITFGTSVYRTIEGKGGDVKRPILFRYLPLGTTYIDVTAQNVHDTTYERRHLTARQIIKHFGESNVSKQISKYAKDPDNNDKFEIIHAIQPRDEPGSWAGGKTNKDTPFASFIIERDTKHVIEDSGYYEFPDVRYVWDEEPGKPYGVGPVSLNLSTIKQANAIGKASLIAGQRVTQPSWATPADGVNGLPPVDMRPDAINKGYLDPRTGEPRIRPMFNQADPSWAQGLTQDSRDSIRQGLLVHLFQILDNNPNESATKTLVQQQEKAELLGPVGTSVQSGLSTQVDREIGILNRKGAFEPGEKYAPPEDAGRLEFGPEYDSPLDRARKAYQVRGTQQALEIALPIAEHDPTVMMNFDFNEIVRFSADILGAPKRIFRSEEERDEIINQQQQLQEAQQLAQLAQQGGAGAQALAGAVTSGAEAVNASADAIPAGADIAGLLGAGAGGEQGGDEFLDLDQTEFEEL